MTQFITQAVYNGTKQNYAITGKNVDSIMSKIRRSRELKKTLGNATCFLFFSRRTGLLKEVRMN